MERRCINLTFHGVGEHRRRLDPGEADCWVSAESLAAVLDSVAHRPDVRITFDDGNASDVEHALPALRRRGLTATFFVVAGRVGTAGFLDAAGIRALSAEGMRIGSHGMRHRPWRRLAQRELTEELVEARRTLEAIVGRPVDTAACPFGSYDRRVLRTLRRCAYARVYTSDRGTAPAEAWLQSRNTVRRDDDDALLQRVAAERSYAELQRRAKVVAKRWR